MGLKFHFLVLQKSISCLRSLFLSGIKVYNIHNFETNLRICFLAAYWVYVCSGINPLMIRFKRRKTRFMINRVSDKDSTICQM